MDVCLTFAKEQKIVTIDITGGAPEMNPHLEYLIEESSKNLRACHSKNEFGHSS